MRVPGITERDQIFRLARAICQETDAATIELGFAKPDDLVPWDSLSIKQQTVYFTLAERLYKRLVYNAASGHIVVTVDDVKVTF